MVDAVEGLLGEVIAAVSLDPSRGGLALDTAVGECTFLLVTGQRFAGVEVILHVYYRTRFGDPTTD